MAKEKIAISIDKTLLDKIDGFAEQSMLNSRSQAITILIKKGLKQRLISTAIILLHENHIGIALSKRNKKTLFNEQLEFLEKNGISKVFVLTGRGSNAEKLLEENLSSNIKLELIQEDNRGTAKAIKFLDGRIDEDFLVMAGDIFIDSSIKNMMKEHLQGNRIATIALMSSKEPKKQGVCELQGSMITHFAEKPRLTATNIVNASIYMFSPRVFRFITSNDVSIEKDLLPSLASKEILYGYFFKGTYEHIVMNSG